MPLGGVRELDGQGDASIRASRERESCDVVSLALRRWLSPALPLSHAFSAKDQCFVRAEDRRARSRLQALACTGNVGHASRAPVIHDECATITGHRVTITLRVVGYYNSHNGRCAA